MKYFDSHAHYYDDRFAKETEGGAEQLLDTLFGSSVSYIVNVGTAPETCALAIEQAKRYPRMFTALGIHPTDGQGLADPDAALDALVSMIRDPENKCVCLGEIGLDYHYPDTDCRAQEYLFDAQMRLARELDIPVCIHDRDAHADVLAMLARYPDVRGIMHSYSGSAEMVREVLRYDFLLSFSGTVTFTNAKKTVEACRAVPTDRLLIETDAPYLAPHPLRGTLNHSGNLVYTNRTVAALHGITEEECAAITEENAKRLFQIFD